MESPPAERDWNRVCQRTAAILFLAGTVVVFLVPPDVLFGSARADLGQQFLAWRAFAASQFRAGHWPLWNPFSYAGEPFLGGFQSGVFYPPNLVFVFLSLGRAANLVLLAHLFILGGGMYRWACRRGLHPLAAGLASLVLALSGPVFPHFYAGHLPNLCTLAWAPWIFGGLEEWARGGNRRALLVASAAVGLQIFAGQLQYVFYIGIAAGIQAVALSLAVPGAGRRALPAAAGVYVFAAALAAAQLLPGMAAASEGLRQGRVDPAFAGQFSFPPENFLTLVAPGFFGDLIGHVYWGRSYPWEMSLFLGVSGLFLLGIAVSDPLRRRSARLGCGIASLLLLLALGQHTPLFRPLYDFAPGFDRFRGWSKFTFPAAVFLALTIAEGADAVLRRSLPGRTAAVTAAAVGFALAAGGLFLALDPARLAPFLTWSLGHGESYLPAATIAAPATVQAAGLQAGRSLAAAGVLFFLAGGSLFLARRRPALRWMVLGMVPVEMIGFAVTQSGSFRLSEAVSPELAGFVASHPGDYRVQNLLEPNNGFLLGAPDIWGNDPGLLRRYAEWMTFSQGGDPDRATQNVTFRAPSPLYRLLRLRYLFTRTDTGLHSYEIAGAMDRVQLVSDYRVQPDRDGLFSALNRPEFDPRQIVLLESEPDIRPSRSTQPGTVKILSSSPDQLTVEADLSAPALLLVTDGYSRDWRARPLAGSSQAQYQVMPADYVLRATPLAAGHHVIRFDYAPEGIWRGIAISALAWALWLAALLTAPGFKTTARPLHPAQSAPGGRRATEI